MKEYVKRTIGVYDRLGIKYLSSIESVAPDEIRLFVKELPKNSSVLDVGCAGGRDSKFFSDSGLRVTGIDLCKRFLDEAKKRVPDGLFLKKDLLLLNFKKESFDGIWASAVLLHVEKRDLLKVLNDLNNLLKSNGVIFIGVKQGVGERSVIDKLSDGQSRYFSFYSKKEIENCVQDSGFSIIYSKIRDDDTGRNYVKWIRIIARKNK